MLLRTCLHARDVFSLLLCRTLIRIPKHRPTLWRYYSKKKHRHVDSATENTTRIRNIGIMAHIDAGKTTTTERMLYYAGATRRMGDVDDGDTVTDYLRQERERGITITSAAVTFDWKDFKFNLIDTPGHIDFTVEVERSLRVLDGAIAVFDASAGVEAQSISVWKQANHYNIPRIVFMNKMDKHNADFKSSVDSLKNKLHAVPLVTQLPVGKGKDFKGVLDVIEQQLLLWDVDKDGTDYRVLPLSQLPSVGSDLLDIDLVQARRDLIEQLTSLDDFFLNFVIEENYDELSGVPAADVHLAVRRCTVAGSGVPVLCGSSLKNKGVQALMDAVGSFLPAPSERAFNKLPEGLSGPFGYAFKVVYDPQRGPLVFLRIYSGSFKPQMSLYNMTRNCKERVSRLLIMFADEQEEVRTASEGNIVVAVGLRNTYTGDVLVGSSHMASSVKKKFSQGKTKGKGDQSLSTANAFPADDVPSLFQSLVVPEPVFFCTVEPSSAAYQKDLDFALDCIAKEDPSLRVTTDPDTGQTILSGMGELHLDIVRDRICTDFKVDATLGRLQISYREAPHKEVGASHEVDLVTGDRRQLVTCVVKVVPLESPSSAPVVSVLDKLDGILPPNSEVRDTTISGVLSACSRGPLLGFPVINVKVILEELSLQEGTSSPVLSACLSHCVMKALAEAGTKLLEPTMSVEVSVPEEHLGTVLNDLSSRRRAEIHNISTRQDSRIVTAHIPLISLVGYSTVLRTLTSGLGTFTSQFSHHTPVSKAQEKAIITELRGY